jgi:hypothetical protein
MHIKKTVVSTLYIALLFLFGSIAVNSVMMVQASTNTIDDFGNDGQSSGSSSLGGSQDTGDETSPSSPGGSQDTGDETSPSSPGGTSNLGTKPELRNQLVNPNAFNYQINPARPTVDISKDPYQYINIAVTNSFGQGVENIKGEVTVKDPKGKSQAFVGIETGKDGKFVLPWLSNIPGKYTAEVTIKSSPAVGGPFKETITWEAINGAAPVTLTTDTKLARQTVDLSDDPRQQILTTVKDAAGKGVKDIPLTIRLTNADGISKTFSRITDANGVDEFVTPIDKEGKWSATVTVIGPDGKPLKPVSIEWKVIP